MSESVCRVKLSLDQASPYPYKGMGVQWDPYCIRPNDEEWRTIMKRVDYLNPRFVRLMIYAPTYCTGLDKEGEPIFRFESEHMTSLIRELDELEKRHIPTILGEWEAPGRFGHAFEGIDAAHPAWAKMIGGLLRYLLIEKQYTCIRYYNYVNEANAEWSWCADYEQWRQGILQLQKEIDRLGLTDRIGIVGPDSVWDEGHTWLRRLREDSQVNDHIAAYDVHMYPTMEEIQTGDVQRQTTEQRCIAPDRDFFMTEAGMVTGKCMGDSQPYVREYCYGVLMADLACQVISSGFSGVAIWDLDDAMHNQKNEFPPEDIRSLKQWGFWNSVAGRVFQQPEDEKIRPHFFTWSLMCNLFVPGSRVLLPQMEAAVPGMRVLAMVHEGKLSLMIVNDGTEDVTVQLHLPTNDHVSQWDVYRYTEDGCKTDRDGFPVPSERIVLPENAQHIAYSPASSVLFMKQIV